MQPKTPNFLKTVNKINLIHIFLLASRSLVKMQFTPCHRKNKVKICQLMSQDNKKIRETIKNLKRNLI